jgi:D-sedoheptulose 7-phosphate isomerase
MRELFLKNVKEHQEQVKYFEKNCLESMIEIFEAVRETINSGHCIYLCGNGGSMADCQHVAGELVGRYKKNRPPLPAVALSTDSALVTCIGNDYAFDEIFSRQVDALINPGDLLWAFSTSGTSKNILKAVAAAREKKAKVVAFTGKQGNALDQLADHSLCAGSDRTNINQEIHELAYHIICEFIDNEY